MYWMHIRNRSQPDNTGQARRRSGKIGKKSIKMRIKFDEPIIGKDNVLEIGSKDLDDFYVSASDIDRMSLFFILLTPPGSHYLALHYMNKAISLNSLPEYSEWLVVMEKGN